MGESENRDSDSELDLSESAVDLDGVTDASSAGGRTPPSASSLRSGSRSANRVPAGKPALPEDPPNDLSGRNLDGLIIQRKLGEGGMGEVWLALDEDLDIPVAVKVLPSHLAGDQQFLMRFLREARAVAKLDHPNIVRVLQAGRREVEGEFLRLMVMEYLEGSDAQALRRSQASEKLEPQLAASIALATAKALKYAHAKGVVHRDIKPANILVSKDGESVKVLDFGLAKLQRRADVHLRPIVQGGRGRPPSTQTGGILGTPQYMAPEQGEGKITDSRVDIYSLGVTLYELLTGTLPYEGDTVFSIIEGHVRKPMVFPSAAFADVPPIFRDLIAGMCEKKPDDRTPLKQVIKILEVFLGVSSGGRTPSSAHDSDAQELKTNLQQRKTSFVGRDDDLGKIGELLEQDNVQLVTLVGPGGVGKTRISQEFGLAQAEADNFEGGVWFCDLTEARSIEGICFAVAHGLDIPLTQTDGVAQLEAALSMRDPLLLILDNFEQVVEHAAETLGRWMAKAPKAKFLASSREPLHLEGERPYPLQPLDSSWGRGSPNPQSGPEGRKDEEKDADVDIRAPREEAPAVQLFIDRASVAKRGFKVDEASLEAIAKIVDQLDGIPLAIELAASRCAALPPQKLLERMPRRFDLLKGRRKDASARQATLRGAIDWSWDLLNEYEKSALAQCSVFQGGFFLEAGEAVIDLSEFDDAPFEMDVIEALVEKSLLVSYEVPTLPGEARYRMLESIRHYAGEKLGEANVGIDALLLRHAEHFIEYAEAWSREIRGPRIVEALDRIELELDNLFGIQDVLLETETELAARALKESTRTLQIRGPWSERIVRLERVLKAIDEKEFGSESLLVYLLRALAMAHHNCGSAEEAEKACQRIKEITNHESIKEHVDYPVVLLTAGSALALPYLISGKGDEISSIISDVFTTLGLETRESRAEFAGDDLDRGSSLMGPLIDLGTAYVYLGDYDRALEIYDEAKALADSFNNLLAAALIEANKGIIFSRRQKFEEALHCYVEAEAIHQKLGNRNGLAQVVGNRGTLLKSLEEYDKALECFESAIAVMRELGNIQGTATVISNCASVHALQGDFERALTCYEEAGSIHREYPNTYGLSITEGNRGRLLGRIGRAEESAAVLLKAEELSRKGGVKYSLAHNLAYRVELIISSGGDLEEAYGLAQESIQLCGELGFHKHSLHFFALAGLAATEYRLGKHDAAREHALEAKAMGEELEMSRYEEHGPKKGEVMFDWKCIDEVLGAPEE